MPHVTETPPPKVQRELEDLRARLSERVPPKKLDENLLVATWNIRHFGGLTEKWTADAADSPKRDLQAFDSRVVNGWSEAINTQQFTARISDRACTTGFSGRFLPEEPVTT